MWVTARVNNGTALHTIEASRLRRSGVFTSVLETLRSRRAQGSRDGIGFALLATRDSVGGIGNGPFRNERVPCLLRLFDLLLKRVDLVGQALLLAGQAQPRRRR